MLLIDLDPQGNASTGLGIERKSRGRGTYASLVEGASLSGLLKPTPIPRLSIVPADLDLVGAELELMDVDGREQRLKKALADEIPVSFVILDCPPSLGLLTLNSLVAANSVLIPLQAEFYALEGLSHMTQTIDRVRRSWNPHLVLEGIVLTMFDRRNNLSAAVADDARGHFGAKVFQTAIPRNVRVSEAPSHGLPVTAYDVRSPGAQAYLNLAAELLRRNGMMT